MANISLIPLKLLTDLVVLVYSLNTNLGTFQQKLIGTFFKKSLPLQLLKKSLSVKNCYTKHSSQVFVCLFVCLPPLHPTYVNHFVLLSTQLLIRNPGTSKSNFLTLLISNSQSTKCQSKP